MMPAQVKVIVFAVTIFLASVPSRAATVVINPSDDAALYVCQGCNLISNGQYLLVDGYIQGAVKFSSKLVPKGMTQALLSVNPYGLPLWGPTLEVYGFTSTSGLIDAASASAGTFLGTWTLPTNLGYGEDAFFDVTAFVASVKPKGGPFIGFNLRNASGTDVFSSIEFNYGHPSQLTIVGGRARKQH